MPHSNTPIRTPYAQRAADFRVRTLPLLVWGAALIAVMLLMYDRSQSFEYIGIAEALDYEISSPAAGRIDEVTVGLFEEVLAGDVVARLDDSLVRAGLATAEAAVTQLSAELEAARLQGRADEAMLIGELRRFQIDEESRRLDMLALRVDIEDDRVERERLDLELKRSRPLLNDGFLSDSDFDNLRLERNRVQARLDQNAELLEQTRAEYEAARSRREAYQGSLPALPDSDELLAPLRQGIEVAALQMEEIQIQRQALLLRSPVAGRVSLVPARAGQAIVPGEPILTVTESTPREIVAWMAEGRERIEPGLQRVAIASRTHPERTAESLILRTGPGIQPMPQRLWRDPRFPDYGRAVVIAAPAIGLIPGEIVTIRFLD